MNGERFTLDTNILVYSVDVNAASRRDVAAEIMDAAIECNCLLTLQALSEFYAVVTRKGFMPPPEAATQVQDWLDLFPCASASASAVRYALSSAVGGRSSYWDGLMIATAAEAGCTTILSEDLTDGAMVGSVRVQNPFTRAGISSHARALLGLK